MPRRRARTSRSPPRRSRGRSRRAGTRRRARRRVHVDDALPPASPVDARTPQAVLERRAKTAQEAAALGVTKRAKWQILSRDPHLGPGRYEVKTSSLGEQIESDRRSPGSCTFGEETTRVFDQRIKAAARRAPPPNRYLVTYDASRPSGGRFSTTERKTDVDWIVYHASFLPDPGQYGAPALPEPGGGRFSTAFPKSPLDWVVYHAKQNPACPLGQQSTFAVKCPLSTYPPSPEFSIASRVQRGNYQTTMSDAIMFRSETAHPDGPLAYTLPSAFGDQPASNKKSPCAGRFGPPKAEQPAPKISDFERFFGYCPFKRKKTKREARTTPVVVKKGLRALQKPTPGPGHYLKRLPSTMGQQPLSTYKTGVSFTIAGD